jgi:hypothetical protein
MDPEFYKKFIVKPEEDVDYMGNKGGFFAHKDFVLVLLLGDIKKKK